MSLYWCVFDGERELDGIDAGSYADFGRLRAAIVEGLEGGRAGSRFPTLVLRSDCDGEWTPEECGRLGAELAGAIAGLKALPPLPDPPPRAFAAGAGRAPRNALECFLDADGEPLLERLGALAGLALRAGRPILFQ